MRLPTSLDPIPRNKSGAKGLERFCESTALQDDAQSVACSKRQRRDLIPHSTEGAFFRLNTSQSARMSAAKSATAVEGSS